MSTTLPPTAPSAPEPTGGSTAETLLRVREYSIGGALLLLILVTWLANPAFLDRQGVEDLLLNSAILVLLATGQSVVVLTRNIDLSVGSVVGLTAFACGSFVSGTDRGPLSLVLLGIALGAACGFLSGALVSFGRVPALVVTLGMLYVIQGVGHAWAHGEQINAATVPDSVLTLGSGSVLGIPWLPLLSALVLAATGYFLRPTAAAGSCTPSDPIPRRRAWRASRCGAGCWPPTSSPAPSPDSQAHCGWRASAPSSPTRPTAGSSPSSARSSSAASPSPGEWAPSGVRHWAHCC